VPAGVDRAAHLEQFVDAFLRPAQEHLCALDVFVDDGAYTAAEAELLASATTLPLKLHVDQLRSGDGAALAARLGARSADHLEYTTEPGARALAAAGTIATVLPGCRMFLGAGPWPRARHLRDAGCEVAIATDCNPGSSMTTNLPLCAAMAVTQCGLTLEEALWGVTQGGARALGLADRGRLTVGQRADFIVLDSPDWRSLLYDMGRPPIWAIARGGVLARAPSGSHA
jgi:imidazolonepropionase